MRKPRPTAAVINALIGEALNIAGQSPLEMEFDPSDLDFDFGPINFDIETCGTALTSCPTSTPAPAPALTGTVKISVRVPRRVIAAFKTRAAEHRQPYQKLLNQVLREAVRGWETPAKA